VTRKTVLDRESEASREKGEMSRTAPPAWPWPRGPPCSTGTPARRETRWLSVSVWRQGSDRQPVRAPVHLASRVRARREYHHFFRFWHVRWPLSAGVAALSGGHPGQGARKPDGVHGPAAL